MFVAGRILFPCKNQLNASEQKTYCFHLQGCLRCWKHWYLTTTSHILTIHKTNIDIITAVRISDFIKYCLSSLLYANHCYWMPPKEKYRWNGLQFLLLITVKTNGACIDLIIKILRHECESQHKAFWNTSSPMRKGTMKRMVVDMALGRNLLVADVKIKQGKKKLSQ